MLTVVCCYNNTEQYNEFVELLKKQTEEICLIGIDNSGNKFQSCSKAYNSVLNDIKTKYVVFSHQDIIFEENDILARFNGYLEQIDVYDILGVAGARNGEKNIYTNICEENGEYAGEERILGIQEFDNVDECFFGGTTEGFRKNPFDEEICNDWHLYAVERCLNAKVNGHKVYACDIRLIHKSKGRISHGFNVNLYQICKKYAGDFKRIRTTCANTSTAFWGRTMYYFKREVRVWYEAKFKYK